MLTGKRPPPGLDVAAIIAEAGMARNLANDLAPRLVANSTPIFSAAARGTGGCMPNNEPLSPIAWAKRAFDKGEAICALTEKEPADSPAMVTLAGSPPKAAIFS